MLSVIAVGSVILSLLVPSGAEPAAVAALAPPDEVTIRDVKVQGNCKKISEVAVSPDRQAFTITYSEYLAQVGPGTKGRDDTKACRTDLRVNVPRGFMWAISKVDYRGFASLEAGASGTETATFGFSGKDRASSSHGLKGPMTDGWQFTDEVPTGELEFGPCGKSRKMNMDTKLTVSAGSSDPTATSFIAMDSVDGEVKRKGKATYHFAWKSC